MFTLLGCANVAVSKQPFKMRTFFLLIICSISFGLKAQIKKDSVVTGLANANQVWYSLDQGEVQSAALSSWHLGFEISGITSSIRFNSAAGHQLYVYPKGDTTDWDNIDTTGLSTWKACYNADTSWDHGAFNINLKPSDPFDLGWGVYNINTHHVVGDSLYIIKMANGDAQKLWLQRLVGGEYFFTTAKLDGSNEVATSLDKADFKEKNFGYFNLSSTNQQDLEPATTDWDLLFTKYTTQIAIGPGMYLPYGVSGVLANAGTVVSKVYPVDNPETFSDFKDLPGRSFINVIGSDWKSYNFMEGVYTIADSTVFIVQTQDASIWKVVMTGYNGAENGQFNFYKELLSSVGTGEAPNSHGVLEVFPNPSTQGSITVASTLKGTNNSVLRVVSLQGTVVAERHLNGGLQTTTLNTESLPAGIYFISIANGNTSITKKLVLR